MLSAEEYLKNTHFYLKDESDENVRFLWTDTCEMIDQIIEDSYNQAVNDCIKNAQFIVYKNKYNKKVPAIKTQSLLKLKKK